MVVYWEYAFAENFLIDGLLLWLAVACTRNKIKLWRLALASAAGAVQAIVFPLFSLPVWASYVVKFAGGVALCLMVAPKGRKSLAITTCAFFALTFAYGGLLTAAYSFFDIEYAQGNGYVVEQAPVALVLCGLLAFAVAVVAGARAFYKHRMRKRSLCECTLTAGERTVQWQGFCDSGNLLSFQGKPVCVVSATGAFALFGKDVRSVGRITVTTVNGSRDAPVFYCDELKIAGRTFGGVYLTVGEVPAKQYQIILHNSFMGEQNETFQPVTSLVKKSGGRG